VALLGAIVKPSAANSLAFRNRPAILVLSQTDPNRSCL
jgi:hypothetical protein